jgi:hypothetical protein
MSWLNFTYCHACPGVIATGWGYALRGGRVVRLPACRRHTTPERLIP